MTGPHGDKGLDLTDPEVREMAEFNHRPKELWRGNGELLSVVCEACGNSWPCDTKRALRALG